MREAKKGRKGISRNSAQILGTCPKQGPRPESRGIFVLCAWGVFAFAVSLGISHLLDGILSEPVFDIEPSYAVLPEASDRVRSYFAQRAGLYVAATVWFLLGLAVLVRGRFADRLLGRWSRLAFHPFWAASAAWAAVCTFTAVWMMPVLVLSTGIERAFGLSTIGLGLWSADRFRDWLLDLAWAPLVGLAWVLIRRYPRRWWLWLGCGLVPDGVLLTLVVPVAVDPLYNAYAPMRNEALTGRIKNMATRAGLRDPVVLVSVRSGRTRKANAYVTGIGPTHRVVIWDTTLQRLAEDEVTAVVAHELGHYRYRHIWWGLAMYTVGGFAVQFVLYLTLPRVVRLLCATGLDDPRCVPAAYLGLTVILLIQTPVASGISRIMERQADAYGLELCRDGEATARAFASFSTDDLSHPDPPRALVLWYYTHPPLRERVGRALAYAERKPEPVTTSGQRVHGLPD